MVEVIMHRQFTHEYGAGGRRTLPAGWRGTVDAKVAKDIKTAQAGRVVKSDAQGGGEKKPEGAQGGGEQ